VLCGLCRIALLAAAFLVLVAAGCGASDGTTTTGVSATAASPGAEEYEVYSVLIQDMYDDGLIVIEGSTAAAHDTDFAANAVKDPGRPDLDDEILSDFKAKNQAPSALEPRFTLTGTYALISEQELESIFANTRGWDDFYAKYPGSQGLLTLSRVGFNEARDTAFLYVAHSIHWTSGEGNVVTMKKTAGRWTVQDTGMIWTS
jgi:hypothetical protein